MDDEYFDDNEFEVGDKVKHIFLKYKGEIISIVDGDAYPLKIKWFRSPRWNKNIYILSSHTFDERWGKTSIKAIEKI